VGGERLWGGERWVGQRCCIKREQERWVERVILDELYPRQILHTGRKKNPPPKHKHIKIK